MIRAWTSKLWMAQSSTLRLYDPGVLGLPTSASFGQYSSPLLHGEFLFQCDPRTTQTNARRRWILDRFFGNFWPRDSFGPNLLWLSLRGSDSYGGDRRSKSGRGPKIVDGPWAVKLYDIVARISGRFTMFGLNALMFVYMHTLHAYMMENTYVSEIVDFTDIQARHRIHAYIGYAMAFSTLFHVWSILFPCLVHGYNAKVNPGQFDLPISERAPRGFKDVDSDKKMVMLQYDDVWRLGEMTVLFCLVLPLTLRWYKVRYRTALKLHQFMFIMYFIDIWRRHTHPHSWVLNTPVFLLWFADLAIGRCWRRLDTTVDRVWISSDYQAVFWKHDVALPPPQVGPLYYLKLKTQALWDRAHPFSAFINHVGLPVPPAEIADCNWHGHVVSIDNGVLVNKTAGFELKSTEGSRVWHAGTVMRVYEREASHTRQIAHAEESPELIIWGPFPENNVIRYALPRCTKSLLLVAGGSGMSFILDYFSQFAQREHMAVLAFTTNDISLYQFFCWTLMTMANRMHHPLKQLYVVAAFTGKIATGIQNEKSLPGGIGNLQTGRLDFDNLCARVQGGEVFAVASGSLQSAVRRAAKANRCKFYAGPVYDNIGKSKQPQKLPKISLK